MRQARLARGLVRRCFMDRGIHQGHLDVFEIRDVAESDR